MKSKEKYLSIISYALAFIISIGFMVFSFVACIYYSYFTVPEIGKCLYNSGYYISSYGQFCTDVSDIIIPTGFEYDTFRGIYDSSRMRSDILNYVKSSIKSETWEVETEEIKTIVNESAVAYLNEEGIEITDDIQESINELSKYIVESYKENVKNKWFKILGSFKKTFVKNISKYLIPISILTVVSIVVLFLIQRWKHRGFRYLIYSSSAAAIVSTGGAAAFYLSGIYKRLFIQPQYFYEFVMCYIENGIKNMIFVTVFWIVWIIVFLIFIKLSKERLHRLGKI